MRKNKKHNPIAAKLFIIGRKLNKLNESFHKLHLIIHQLLTYKTLSISIKIYNKTIFFFLVLLHQIILYVIVRIFQKECKNYDNR